MNSIDKLKSFINSIKGGKLAILCIGNDLNGDDGVGPFIYHKLKDRIKKEYLIYNVHVSPENFLSVLEKENVTHCLLIDSVEFGIKGIKPGTVGFFKPNDIKAYQEILTTHDIPLRVYLDYIEVKTHIVFRILGIQPKNVDIGASMSLDVLKALDNLVPVLLYLLE